MLWRKIKQGENNCPGVKQYTGSEKLKFLVIWKAKNPRRFKGIKSLDVDYEFNKNAWKTSEIFTKWILNLWQKIWDAQCKLKNIYLPNFFPSMTSLLQPIDQGIIYKSSLSSQYGPRFLPGQGLSNRHHSSKLIQECFLPLQQQQHYRKRIYWLNWLRKILVMIIACSKAIANLIPQYGMLKQK